MLRLAWVLIGWLAILTILWGCVPSMTSPLTPEPCSWPCWHEITPGKTTLVEAWYLLLYDDRIEAERYDDRVMWRWIDSPNRQGAVKGDNGIVSAILVPLQERLTLGEVVEVYGSPEKFEAQFILGPHGPGYWAVDLYYPQRGFVVFSSAPSWREGDLSPDIEVDDVLLFEPTAAEEYFKGLPDSSNLQDWTGFHPGETPDP